jgi:predicted transcriptional regulator
MKHTTIMLDESVLFEIQQLAKERHTTTSQVIQQAVTEYVEGQRRSAVSAPVAEEQWPEAKPSEPLAERVQPLEAKPEPVPLEGEPSLTEGGEGRTGRFPWVMWVSLAAGGLSALSALFLLVQAAGELIGRARGLEVVVNFLLPGLLLGLVAAAFLFIASQSQQSRPAEREDNQGQ